MHDVLICGTCLVDILVKPVGLAAPIGGGRLFHVDPIEVATGGLVCNTGIAMRRLGMRVGASSLVGGDPWGDTIRARHPPGDVALRQLPHGRSRVPRPAAGARA
jgi:sugar/nucleoside kinase (ribokinase family)